MEVVVRVVGVSGEQLKGGTKKRKKVGASGESSV